jgi:hypothetical protein
MASIEHLTLTTDTVGTVGTVTGGGPDARHILVTNHAAGELYVLFSTDGSTPANPAVQADDTQVIPANRSRIFEVGVGDVVMKAIGFTGLASPRISVGRLSSDAVRNGETIL